MHIWDIAIATIFWLLMGYNFSCVIASNMLFDSRGCIFWVKLSDEDMVTIFSLSIYGVHIGATW